MWERAVKSRIKRASSLTALVILLVSMAPMVYASTLTVNLNPKTGLAKVEMISTTKIVFAYPAGSPVSTYFKNASSSLDLKGNFNGGTPGTGGLQGSLNEYQSRISVTNMSVAVDYTAQGNSTAYAINKVTDVTAWVSGVFSVINGTVHADLSWRSFVVRGALDLDLEAHSVDINLVGSTVQYSLTSNGTAAGFLLSAFGGGSLWNRPTLNFSALNSPLSTWSKNYDAATNTTTFSKAIPGHSTFTASVDFNGQKYSLSAVSDPSGMVSVQGYANASSDSLVIGRAPSSAATGLLGLGAAVVVLGVAGYLAVRYRRRTAAS